MKIIYLEHRAAARLLLKDAGEKAPVERILLASSAVLEIQLQRLLESRRLDGRLSESNYAAKRREAAALLLEMHLFPMGEEVVELARPEYPFAVAAIDSIHVATAQLVRQETEDLEFWTHDASVAAAARHRGLLVRGVDLRA